MALQRPPLTVRDDLNLPGVPTQKDASWVLWMRDFLTFFHRMFRIHQHLFPATLSGEMRVNEYVTATKPAAATAGKGAIIFVSDGGAGAVFQGSTGAAWVNLG